MVLSPFQSLESKHGNIYGIMPFFYACFPKGKKRVNSHVLEDFKDDEDEKIKEITESIVKLVPTLIDKKIDLFSSKVNQNLNGV